MFAVDQLLKICALVLSYLEDVEEVISCHDVCPELEPPGVDGGAVLESMQILPVIRPHFHPCKNDIVTHLLMIYEIDSLLINIYLLIIQERVGCRDVPK